MSANQPAYPGRAVYVVDGCRTPFLKAEGKPGPFSASDMAHSAGRTLISRMPFAADAFDEVVVGCVMPGPDEVNIGRIISLRLGCGDTVPAWTVQRNCASGLQALDCAAQHISSGVSDLVLAGGTEAMSHAPLLFRESMVRWLGSWYKTRSFGQRMRVLSQLRPAYFAPIIGLLKGLSDPIVCLSMGQTAENLAYRFDISREQMDEHAVRSHMRLANAFDQGLMQEIDALYDSKGNVYEQDTGLRRDSSVDRLARLRPAFDKPYGKVTAGNSAQITDGAAMLVLASEQAVEKYQLPILGRIVDCNWAGVDPAQMGLGPVNAATPLLQRNDMAMGDVDNWEINEAFATQVMACVAAWQDDDYCRNELGLDSAFGKLDESRLNVDGGGISIGHPVGATGARIVLHSLKVLQRTGGKRAVASLCIGGGQGGAMLLERMES